MLFVLGGGSLLLRWNNTIEYLPLIVGVALFLAPSVLGFSGIAAMAWSAWIIGVLAVISAGSAFLVGGNLTGRSSAAAH